MHRLSNANLCLHKPVDFTRRRKKAKFALVLKASMGAALSLSLNGCGLLQGFATDNARKSLAAAPIAYRGHALADGDAEVVALYDLRGQQALSGMALT